MEKPGNKASREFDDPQRYEREKVTRVMPENLHHLGLYTLRVMMPPGSRPFAVEYLTVVRGEPVRRDSEHWDVSYVWYPGRRDVEPEIADTIFNNNGFMVISNEGDDEDLADFPDEIEMAYFVGSLDPADLEFGELIAKAKELVPSI